MTQLADGARPAPRPAHQAGRPARPPRRIVDGIAFDACTEKQAADYVLDCLDCGHGGLIMTPNTDILRLLQRPENGAIAARADLVLADGMPVVWASRIAGTRLPERVAGSSFVTTLAREAAHRGRSLYIMGGPPGAAEMANANLMRRFPNLCVVGTSCPPMGFQDDEDAWQTVVGHLVQTRPDIVYLAFGAPKQEGVGMRLAELLPGTWFLGCGASVTFLAEIVPQAPAWMQRSGLEWLHRLGREPGRLWRRYLVDDIPYALTLLARSLRVRFRCNW